MSWRAHPTTFVALATIQILQGVQPVAAAWVTKAIFDRLVTIVQTPTEADFWQIFWLLLVLYLLLTVGRRALSSIT
jgi:hypothetical protein